MHYRLHVRSLLIDPDVEAHAGVRPPAGHRFQVLVDQHHALGGGFVEAVAELEGPPRPGLVGSCSDLPGEARFVAFAREDAAAGGEELRRASFEQRQILGHFAIHAVDELLFHFIKLGR